MRQDGDNSQQIIFWNMIKEFSELGILPSLVLIGSWAEYIYQESGILNYRANLRTQDVDWVVDNIRRAAPPVDLHQALVERDFVPIHDRLTNLVRFDKDGQIEVEFLAVQKGSGEKSIMDIPPWKINAQSLRHLDILTENRLSVLIRGHIIHVPSPAAYVFQKLRIHEARTPQKKEKDIRAIQNIMPHILENPEMTLKLLVLIRREKSGKQKEIIELCKANYIELPS